MWVVLYKVLTLSFVHFYLVGNKMRAEEQRKKEKAIKEEQKRAYGAILQLKQRQRAEVSGGGDRGV